MPKTAFAQLWIDVSCVINVKSWSRWMCFMRGRVKLFILKWSREQLQLIAAAGSSAGLSCERCSAYILHLHQLPDIMQQHGGCGGVNVQDPWFPIQIMTSSIYYSYLSAFNAAADWWLAVLIRSTVRYFPCFNQVIKTCKKMGIQTVAVHSDVDSSAVSLCISREQGISDVRHNLVLNNCMLVLFHTHLRTCLWMWFSRLNVNSSSG